MGKYFQKIKTQLFKHTLSLNIAGDQYYSRIFNKYDKLEAYLSLHQKSLSGNYLQTLTNIEFIDNIKFGFNIKDIAPYIPTTNYQVLSNETLNTKILFYKMFIADHRVKCQIHFFRGKMFLCSYTFSYLKDSQQNEITDILRNKYLPGTKYSDGDIIRDSLQNCISIENSLEYTLNYMPLNNEIFDEIKAFKNSMDDRKKDELNAREREIFNKL